MNPPINLIENESTDEATSVGLDLDAPIVGCGREGIGTPVLDNDQPLPLPDQLVRGEVRAHRPDPRKTVQSLIFRDFEFGTWGVGRLLRDFSRRSDPGKRFIAT